MKIDFKSVDLGFDAALQRTRNRFPIQLARLRDLQPAFNNVLEKWPEEAKNCPGGSG
jgi:hypothetical protein